MEKNRNSEILLGTKSREVMIKNRVILSPMASDTANDNGFVTEKTLTHYERLMQVNVGLAFVEYSFVHKNGRSEAHQLGIDNDNQIEGLRKIAKIFKKNNAIAGIQITHSGGKSTHELANGKMIAPSNIIVPVKDAILETPFAASLHDIKIIKDSFLEATTRAIKADFEILEIHAAHGYGLNQWISPFTNQRNDKYGGDVENRIRLLMEIVYEIRASFPNLLLAVRFPGQDQFESGLTTSDALKIALALEKAGVDLLDISSGIGGWRRPKNRRGEGYLISEAEIIKKHVSIPVTGVGGIKTAKFIDKLISKNIVDFASVGRAILDDPINFQKTVGLI